jgi:hypothetical protein
VEFIIKFADQAGGQFDALEANPALGKRFKAVRKALAWLESNPRHPGLNTHEFDELEGPDCEKVFEAYAENQTAGAYRIFFCYPSEKTRARLWPGFSGRIIFILAITAHP